MAYGGGPASGGVILYTYNDLRQVDPGWNPPLARPGLAPTFIGWATRAVARPPLYRFAPTSAVIAAFFVEMVGGGRGNGRKWARRIWQMTAKLLHSDGPFGPNLSGCESPLGM